MADDADSCSGGRASYCNGEAAGIGVGGVASGLFTILSVRSVNMAGVAGAASEVGYAASFGLTIVLALAVFGDIPIVIPVGTGLAIICPICLLVNEFEEALRVRKFYE